MLCWWRRRPLTCRPKVSAGVCKSQDIQSLTVHKRPQWSATIFIRVGDQMGDRSSIASSPPYVAQLLPPGPKPVPQALIPRQRGGSGGQIERP